MRESGHFWIITDDDRVVQALGFICEPRTDPELWFFPGYGFSTSEVYTDPDKARVAAINQINVMIGRLMEARSRIIADQEATK